MLFSGDDGYQFFLVSPSIIANQQLLINKVTNLQCTETYSQKIEPYDISLAPKASHSNNVIIIF